MTDVSRAEMVSAVSNQCSRDSAFCVFERREASGIPGCKCGQKSPVSQKRRPRSQDIVLLRQTGAIAVFAILQSCHVNELSLDWDVRYSVVQTLQVLHCVGHGLYSTLIVCHSSRAALCGLNAHYLCINTSPAPPRQQYFLPHSCSTHLFSSHHFIPSTAALTPS